MNFGSLVCVYCGAHGGTIDHLIPKARGGNDRPYNKVRACEPCNQDKADSDPVLWIVQDPSRAVQFLNHAKHADPQIVVEVTKRLNEKRDAERARHQHTKRRPRRRRGH